MPSMANITVKNKAGSDVVYVASVPSAGDKSPARWTFEASSAIIGFRPTLEVVTRSNSARNGRIVEVNGTYPIVETVDGRLTVSARVPFKLLTTAPTNVDSALAEDAFVQFGNLIVSTLMRSVFGTGYAPT